jgi:hypothetical protein
MLDGFVKSPYAALHFILRHYDVPVGATLCGRPKARAGTKTCPYKEFFARLAFGTFYCAVSASALREIAHA